jgi:hypothetical protein
LFNLDAMIGDYTDHVLIIASQNWEKPAFASLGLVAEVSRFPLDAIKDMPAHALAAITPARPLRWWRLKWFDGANVLGGQAYQALTPVAL